MDIILIKEFSDIINMTDKRILDKNTVYEPFKPNEYYAKVKNKLPVQEGNIKLITEFLQDMELGRNVGQVRGRRSARRLINVRNRLIRNDDFLFRHYNICFSQLTKNILHDYAYKLETGVILSLNNKPMKSWWYLIRDLKVFWNWGMRVGHFTENIFCEILKPKIQTKFNYLKIEEVQKLADQSKLYYKSLIWFLFDSGIRAPKELMNVSVSDLEHNGEYYTLNIKEESSKTYGRKIKLLLCSEILKKHIKHNELKKNMQLFWKSPNTHNNYLSKLCYDILKIGERHKRKDKINAYRYKGLTMYDFRHNSACYWRPRYPSESAFKYRFGWKHDDMPNYYTKFLGMSDTITSEDIIDPDEKIGIIKKLDQQKSENNLMKEQLKQMQDQMNEFVESVFTQINDPNKNKSIIENLTKN